MNIGHHRLPVDGVCTTTSKVYQFQGCFWHAHPCSKTRTIGEFYPVREISMSEVYAKTLKKSAYIESLGNSLVVMCECEWEDFVVASPHTKSLFRAFFIPFYGSRRTRTESEIIDDIRNGNMFSLVKCDFHVPDRLTSKFSKMAPSPKTQRSHVIISVGIMKTFAAENGHLKQLTRALVGSLFGKEILLFSELLA